MMKRQVPNRGLMIVTAIMAGAITVVFGLMSNTWELCAIGPLVVIFGVGVAYRQMWAVYLLLLVAAAGVVDMVYHLYIERSQPERATYYLYRAAVAFAAAYALQLQLAKERVKRTRTIRAKSSSAAAALEAMADSDGAAPAPPDDNASVELADDAPGDDHVFRSLVLLTRNQPRLDPAKVKDRLSHWMGIAFPEESAENFIAGNDNIYMVKLRSVNIYMITLLNRPYWDSEEVEPYELVLKSKGEDEHIDDLRAAQGAILIDAHISQMPDSLMLLAKLTAACFNSDTTVMLSPTGFKAQKCGAELAKSLVGAKDPSDLLGAMCSVVPFFDDGRIECKTMGMSAFDLPDVRLEVEDNEEQYARAMAAVQSVASYQAKRGTAIPDGDTCEVTNTLSYLIPA